MMIEGLLALPLATTPSVQVHKTLCILQLRMPQPIKVYTPIFPFTHETGPSFYSSAQATLVTPWNYSKTSLSGA